MGKISTNRKILLVVSIISFAVFSVMFIENIFEEPVFSRENNHTESSGNLSGSSANLSNLPAPFSFGLERRSIPLDRLFISPILLIIAVITISYYFISKTFDERMEESINVIMKIIDKKESLNSKKTDEKPLDNKNVVLKLLNFNERKVLEKLIENNGKIAQSKINECQGMTKLKTHRAVKDLESKGIIKTEKYGKTNMINLDRDVKDLFLK